METLNISEFISLSGNINKFCYVKILSLNFFSSSWIPTNHLLSSLIRSDSPSRKLSQPIRKRPGDDIQVTYWRVCTLHMTCSKGFFLRFSGRWSQLVQVSSLPCWKNQDIPAPKHDIRYMPEWGSNLGQNGNSSDYVQLLLELHEALFSLWNVRKWWNLLISCVIMSSIVLFCPQHSDIKFTARVFNVYLVKNSSDWFIN